MPDRKATTMQNIPAEILEILSNKAKSASEKAYCPYSKFRVGAALWTDAGDTFSGCNVENVSYGLTMCAERNAIFQMVASGPEQRIRAILVYTPTESPSSPCGACRQVINEFGPTAAIFGICHGKDRIKTTLTQLLPQAFGPRNLE